MQTNENKYYKKIYLLLKSDSDRYPTRKNWCTLLKHLLCNLGFYQVWLCQDVGQTKIFLLNVKNRLKDQFIQGWNGIIQGSSRASLYRLLAFFKISTLSVFVTFLKSDLFWLDYEFHLTDYKFKAEDGLDLTLYPYMVENVLNAML